LVSRRDLRSRRTDNEEKSAAWAAQGLLEATADPERIERLTALILATKHVDPAIAGDEALLVDIDLAILGARRVRFIEYESQVRQEYAWVPDELFRKTRASILRRFLERPRIYGTGHFADLLESHARANLRFSLESLDV
jgi:predicted metal-dependent HD superfamily phosphohydrolase